MVSLDEAMPSLQDGYKWKGCSAQIRTKADNFALDLHLERSFPFKSVHEGLNGV